MHKLKVDQRVQHLDGRIYEVLAIRSTWEGTKIDLAFPGSERSALTVCPHEVIPVP